MKAPIRDTLGGIPIPQSWVTWFETVDNFIRSGSSSGTTANRPTKNLFVGLSYMDTTLGKQIQIQSLNPTVWVDSAGDDPDVPAVVAEEKSSMVWLGDFSSGTRFSTATAFAGTLPVAFALSGYTQIRYIFLSRFSVSDSPLGVEYGVGFFNAANLNPAASSPDGYVTSSTVNCGGETFNTSYPQDSGWCDILEEAKSDIIYLTMYIQGGDDVADSCFANDLVILIK